MNTTGKEGYEPIVQGLRVGPNDGEEPNNFAPGAGCPDCHFTEVIANNDPAPEAGVCMYNHDHNAEPDRCVWHD